MQFFYSEKMSLHLFSDPKRVVKVKMDDTKQPPRNPLAGDTNEETHANLLRYLRHLMRLYGEYSETPEGLMFELENVYELTRCVEIKNS